MKTNIGIIHITEEEEKNIVTIKMNFENNVEATISNKLKEAIIETLKMIFVFDAEKIGLDFKEDKVVLVTLNRKLEDGKATEIIKKINEGNFTDEVNEKIKDPGGGVQKKNN